MSYDERLVRKRIERLARQAMEDPVVVEQTAIRLAAYSDPELARRLSRTSALRLSRYRMAEDAADSGGSAGGDDWERGETRTGKTVWFRKSNPKDRRYQENKPGTRAAKKEPTGDAPAKAAKQKKLSPDEAKAKAGEIKSRVEELKGKATPEQVAEVGGELANFTGKQLEELKAELGMKASGTLASQAQKIAAKLLGVEAKKAEPKAKPEKPAKESKAKPKGEAELNEKKLELGILDAINGNLGESVDDLREKMPEELRGKEFDDTLKKLAKEGKLQLNYEETEEDGLVIRELKGVMTRDDFDPTERTNELRSEIEGTAPKKTKAKTAPKKEKTSPEAGKPQPKQKSGEKLSPEQMTPQDNRKLEKSVLSAIKDEFAVDIGELRKQMPPEYQGKAFNELIKKLATDGKVIVSADADPKSFTEEQRQQLIQSGNAFLTTITIRDDGFDPSSRIAELDSEIQAGEAESKTQESKPEPEPVKEPKAKKEPAPKKESVAKKVTLERASETLGKIQKLIDGIRQDNMSGDPEREKKAEGEGTVLLAPIYRKLQHEFRGMSKKDLLALSKKNGMNLGAASSNQNIDAIAKNMARHVIEDLESIVHMEGAARTNPESGYLEKTLTDLFGDSEVPESVIPTVATKSRNAKPGKIREEKPEVKLTDSQKGVVERIRQVEELAGSRSTTRKELDEKIDSLELDKMNTNDLRAVAKAINAPALSKSSRGELIKMIHRVPLERQESLFTADV